MGEKEIDYLLCGSNRHNKTVVDFNEKLVSSSLFSKQSVENEYRELHFFFENLILDTKFLQNFTRIDCVQNKII